MTDQQLRAFEFIDSYIKANRKSPSFREIMAALGLASPSCPARLVTALAKLGFISSPKNRNRSIEILRRPGDPPAIPLPTIQAFRDLIGEIDQSVIQSPDQNALLAIFSPATLAAARNALS